MTANTTLKSELILTEGRHPTIWRHNFHLPWFVGRVLSIPKGLHLPPFTMTGVAYPQSVIPRKMLVVTGLPGTFPGRSLVLIRRIEPWGRKRRGYASGKATTPAHSLR